MGVEGSEAADRAAVDATDGILPKGAFMRLHGKLVDTPEVTGSS